jgi:hypothetical protein
MQDEESDSEGEDNEEAELWTKLENISAKFKETNQRYEELEKDERYVKDLVEITNSKLVAQESVLRLLTDQKKLFNSQAGAVSGLTAGESAAIQQNAVELSSRVTACTNLCHKYQGENHDAKLRYRNIDRELNTVRPDLMKVQREKNHIMQLLLNRGYTQKKINERIQEHADNEAEDIYGSIYGALDDSIYSQFIPEESPSSPMSPSPVFTPEPTPERRPPRPPPSRESSVRRSSSTEMNRSLESRSPAPIPPQPIPESPLRPPSFTREPSPLPPIPALKPPAPLPPTPELDNQQAAEQRQQPPVPKPRKMSHKSKHSASIDPVDIPDNWYREIERKEEEELLQEKPDGTFLVRPAGSNKKHKYTLTLKYGTLRRMQIYEDEYGNCGFSLGNLAHASLVNLIRYYMQHTLENHSKQLTTTLKYTCWGQ